MSAFKPGEFLGRFYRPRTGELQYTTDKGRWPAAVRERQPFLCGTDVNPPARGDQHRSHRGNCQSGTLRVGYQADQGNKQYTRALRPLSLTKLEEEWLGATVRVKGENQKQTYQVWSLCDPSLWIPQTPGVFLVWNQLTRPMQINRLVRC